MADPSTGAVLTTEAIRFGLRATDKWDAVRQAGTLLVELGAVEPAYADAMLERERSLSTYIGAGVAIPHGTDAARALVRRTALGVLAFPAGVDWDGEQVLLCVAIAAGGEEHVQVLSELASVLVEPDQAERLRTTTDPEEVLALLAGAHSDPAHSDPAHSDQEGTA